jgi:hypothetical protein
VQTDMEPATGIKFRPVIPGPEDEM